MQICAQKSNHKFVFTDVAEGYEKLDITNLDAIREKVRENDIQVIVNCAAYTNVDKAETDYDLANLLNNTAAGNLAQAMKEVDGTLIHVSTDYVFQAFILFLNCQLIQAINKFIIVFVKINNIFLLFICDKLL